VIDKDEKKIPMERKKKKGRENNEQMMITEQE
jgi:hypothetical protein